MNILIKEEKFIKDNVPYIKKYFGTDEEHITGILEAPVVEDENINVNKLSSNDIAISQILLTQQEMIIKQNENEKILSDFISSQKS